MVCEHAPGAALVKTTGLCRGGWDVYILLGGDSEFAARCEELPELLERLAVELIEALKACEN